jgi:uncharacterized protein (TIGR02246 family)
LDCWNARDARQYADLFTEGATVIGFDGTTMVGRQQIFGEIDQIFRSHPTARYVRIVREIRELADGVVSLRADVGMIPPGQSTIKPEVNAVQVLVAVGSTDQEWRIALFQNTPAAFHGRPDLARDLTAELSAVSKS